MINPHLPPDNIIDAVQVCFAKYATFSGRAARAEYWWFTLFSWSLPIVLSYFLIPLAGLASLVLFIPLLAVQVRRLHDINKSAWWMLLMLLPVLGTIILLLLSLQQSYPFKNLYDLPKTSF